ncbi:serine hydrolase [Lacihabitans sp. LS3-19]|uniref:serine hydrolase n=1 Tax=Lacihabitans sp. LS3-19 TaxID=2487335 RepID=UPI0020CFD25D|nr:serine hydrolase [Lacihabitans sp. LS3-19]MCP9767671.1 serine hydrolase [Lacihabitans sp. LS3-19]
MSLKTTLTWFYVFSCFFSTSIFAQKKSALNQTKTKIEKLISKSDGKFAVAFKDLSNRNVIFINEHEYFHAASTMKTPVMMEVFNQISQKKLNLKDSIEVRNEFKSIVDQSTYSLDLSDDSDDVIYSKIGTKITLEDLIFQMITVSSNFATNILIDKVGAENVMKYLNKNGINENIVLRGVEDTKAFNAGLNNRTTAYGLMQVFELLEKENHPKMKEILFAQKFNEIIPAKLPKDVKVAHKTGSITGVQHDSGIVYLPDGRKYVLILLSKELKNPKAGVETLSEISKIIYTDLFKKS